MVVGADLVASHNVFVQLIQLHVGLLHVGPERERFLSHTIWWVIFANFCIKLSYLYENKKVKNGDCYMISI